jgi:hypothetical protein
MLAILCLLTTFAANLFRSRRQLEVENLFLRHQLNIALRRAPRRLRLHRSDRAVLGLADTTVAKPDRIGPRGSARHYSAVASLRILRLLALEISRPTRETQSKS